jgi:hypothetical protein
VEGPAIGEDELIFDLLRPDGLITAVADLPAPVPGKHAFGPLKGEPAIHHFVVNMRRSVSWERHGAASIPT